MKINISKPKTLTFCELPCKDLFMSSFGCLYVKQRNEPECDEFNAVSIGSGTMSADFKPEDTVIPVKEINIVL